RVPLQQLPADPQQQSLPKLENGKVDRRGVLRGAPLLRAAHAAARQGIACDADLRGDAGFTGVADLSCGGTAAARPQRDATVARRGPAGRTSTSFARPRTEPRLADPARG